MPQCPKCGKENDVDSDFCEKCGAPLKKGNPQQEKGQDKNSNYCPNCKQEVVPRTPRGYWGGIALLIFIALLLSYFFFIGTRFRPFLIVIIILLVILKPKECPMCKYRFKRGSRS